jgi:hypothetical protein
MLSEVHVYCPTGLGPSSVQAQVGYCVRLVEYLGSSTEIAGSFLTHGPIDTNCFGRTLGAGQALEVQFTSSSKHWRQVPEVPSRHISPGGSVVT